MDRIIEVAVEVDPSPVSETALIELFCKLDACPSHSIDPGDLSVALVDETTIRGLHEAFLNDPSPTDVITFPGDPESEFAGEIVVSVDQALSEHTKHGNSVSEEILLYMVHGWLHLAGEDDLEDEPRKKMRAAEKSVLAWLKDDGFSL